MNARKMMYNYKRLVYAIIKVLAAAPLIFLLVRYLLGYGLTQAIVTVFLALLLPFYMLYRYRRFLIDKE